MSPGLHTTASTPSSCGLGDGARATLPLLPGVVAFGAVYGVLARGQSATWKALLAPPLLLPEGRVAPGIEAAAALPAAAVAWRTRQVPPTVLACLAAYWLLRWLL